MHLEQLAREENQMHTSQLLMLIAGIAGQQPDVPPMFKEFAPAVTFYYKSPDPSLGPKMLKELLKKENLEHPWFEKKGHVLVLIGAQLGDIAAGKPKIVREYEAAFADAPLTGQRVIARSLGNCGDAETIKKVSAWLGDEKYADIRPELAALKKHLEDPKRQHIRDRPAKTPDDLDLLWSNFFVTGEYAPVSRILDVLDQADARENAVMKRVAKWSLGANLGQHPKLVEIVQKHAGERAEGSWSVLEELKIVKDDPKGAEEMKKLLVGKWISDDDQKVPLEFLKDGSAKVGFIVEEGKWLIAEGTFTVSGKGLVKSKTMHAGSTLFSSWTLKDGVLVGSHGPKPMVKWVKAKPQ
jgi:uncharacterized protein (TIGR03066 family)